MKTVVCNDCYGTLIYNGESTYTSKGEKHEFLCSQCGKPFIYKRLFRIEKPNQYARVTKVHIVKSVTGWYNRSGFKIKSMHGEPNLLLDSFVLQNGRLIAREVAPP